MTKQLLPILFALLVLMANVNAQQQVKMSAVPDYLFLSCEQLLNDFLDTYDKEEDVTPYLTRNEANFAGQLWLPIDQFTSFLGNFLKRPVGERRFSFYTMDDVDQDPELLEVARKFGLAFDNYSVLAEGSINDKQISIVMRVEDGAMKIYSFGLWHVPLMWKADQPVIPTDTLLDLGIAFKLPTAFDQKTQTESGPNYIHTGETGQDEAIQIFSNPKQAPLALITYKWAEYVTSNYRRTDFDIGYLPNGYMIRCEIMGENEQVNKAITVGLEHKGNIILIQYFGLIDMYNSHWQELDIMMRNIRKL